jgi:hypothetical protein
MRYGYYSSSQNVNSDSKLEKIVRKLKSWGIDLSNRVIKSRDGSERQEGYRLKIDNNIIGEIYVFDSRLIINLDYISCK